MLDLDKVPVFIVVTDAEGFHRHSWIVQCEVIEQQLLGGQPTDEEPIPNLNMDDINPVFDFFGFGQAAPQALHDQLPAQAEDNEQEGDMAWGLWPQQDNVIIPANPAIQEVPDDQAQEESGVSTDSESDDSVNMELPDLNAPNVIEEDVLFPVDDTQAPGQDQINNGEEIQPDNQIVLAIPAA